MEDGGKWSLFEMSLDDCDEQMLFWDDVEIENLISEGGPW
jgi:hypothetical protein